MEFSKEQQLAYNKYIQGKNIFITGPGGTGKTALIKQIKKNANERCIDIQVCALTGCAAILLECKAKTLHSWSGIGLGNGTIDGIVAKIMKNKFTRSNWKEIDILVVDEVSMMSQKLFEILDAIGKATRKNSRPFGGIQLVFSGDFYQLPPVGNKDEPETMKFCFESPLWEQTFPIQNHIQLTKIFRQNDEIFGKILNQIREGRLKRSCVDKLNEHVDKEIPQDLIIKPTKLYPTRAKVDSINTYEMSTLTGPEYEYKIKYVYDLPMSNQEKSIRLQFSPEQIKMELQFLQSNLRCDETIKLKIGSQVMCIVNIELTNGDMICNGSQGTVMKINNEGLPVIKFINGYTLTMNYYNWPSENIPGIGIKQIPLILSWAVTIHKSQGATLHVAEIDAGSSIFECGQTYVALSRVKSLDGLYLTSFDPNRIRINKKVRDFYDMLDKQIDRQQEEKNEIVECMKVEEKKQDIKRVKLRENIIEEKVNVNKLDQINIFSEFEYKQDIEEDKLCVVCKENSKNVVLLPCRHMCLCKICSENINKCPICRKDINEYMQVFS
jgi:ATP-dependent DNA helicase PIF1